MANFVFNIALGKIAEKVADGATLKLLLLKNAGADNILKDMDNIAAILAEVSTDEADFTSYSRPTLAGLSANVDDGNDGMDVVCNNVTFLAATTGQGITDYIIYEEVTNDSDNVPLVQGDAVFTTDGNDVTLDFTTNGGFFGAT